MVYRTVQRSRHSYSDADLANPTKLLLQQPNLFLEGEHLLGYRLCLFYRYRPRRLLLGWFDLGNL